MTAQLEPRDVAPCRRCGALKLQYAECVPCNTTECALHSVKRCTICSPVQWPGRPSGDQVQAARLFLGLDPRPRPSIGVHAVGGLE